MKTQHFVEKSHGQWKSEYSQRAKAECNSKILY